MPAAVDDRALLRDRVLVATLVVALAVTVVMTATRSLEFGSSSGNFAYGYLRAFQWSSLLLVAVLVPLAVWTAWAAPRLQREWQGAALILAVGTLAQFVLRQRSPFSLSYASRVERDYFDVAQSYGARDLLRNFEVLAPSLPTHARANMPGKVLLFEVLLPISESHAVLSVLISLLSAAAGVAVYLMARSLFGSSTVARMALLLYLFLPARIYFLPLLNTVTPLFLALLVWALVSYLRRARRWLPPAIGVGTYLTMLFEPTPVLLFGIFAVLAVATGMIRRLDLREIVSLAGLGLLGFGATHVAMLGVFGFDLVGAFGHVQEDAADFNTYWGRGYLDFLVPNVRELIVNSGVVLALLALGATAWAVLSLRRTLHERRPAEPLAVLAVAGSTTLLVLAGTGVSRGEVSRLWIFEAVMLAVVAAGICASRPGLRLLPYVLAAGIFQAALAIGPVGFAVQGRYCPHCQGLPKSGLSVWFDVFLACCVVVVTARLWRRQLARQAPDLLESARAA